MAEFDPDKYLAEKNQPEEFDPDRYLSEKKKPVPSEPVAQKDVTKADKGKARVDNVSALLAGFGQGSTLGFSDKVTAAAKSAFGPDTYEQELAKARAELKQLQESNAYLAGEVAGWVASAIIPGLGIARAAKAGIKIAQLASSAPTLAKLATAGGISGAGYSEAETAPELAEDIGIGALTGTLAGAIGPAARLASGPVKGAAKLAQKGKALFQKLPPPFRTAILAAGLMGDSTGMTMTLWLAKHYGPDVLEKIGKSLGKSPKKASRFKELMGKGNKEQVITEFLTKQIVEPE